MQNSLKRGFTFQETKSESGNVKTHPTSTKLYATWRTTLKDKIIQWMFHDLGIALDVTSFTTNPFKSTSAHCFTNNVHYTNEQNSENFLKFYIPLITDKIL